MSINFTDKKPGDFGVVDKPQSDLEKFIDLYRSVGIEIVRGVNKDKDQQVRGYQYIEIESDVINFYGEDDRSGLAKTLIYFDESGKFIQQGIWE